MPATPATSPARTPPGIEILLASLRAGGESTRLRILAILEQGEAMVGELAAILMQSQPGMSRHLKVLGQAGLVRCHREGRQSFYRLPEGEEQSRVLAALLALLPARDRILARDRERLRAVRRQRTRRAAAYFRKNAHKWAQIRALHASENRIEAALLAAAGKNRKRLMLDLGTGTGRMLEIFAAQIEAGIGFDISPEMLALARVQLSRAGLAHCRLEQENLFALPLAGGQADFAVMHQVLHYLDAPRRAIREAARTLAPGGRLLIADFAPHSLEFLRAEHHHRRLGFAENEVAQWLSAAGLRTEAVRHLPPGSGQARQLTVSIWAARRPRPAA